MAEEAPQASPELAQDQGAPMSLEKTKAVLQNPEDKPVVEAAPGPEESHQTRRAALLDKLFKAVENAALAMGLDIGEAVNAASAAVNDDRLLSNTQLRRDVSRDSRDTPDTVRAVSDLPQSVQAEIAQLGAKAASVGMVTEGMASKTNLPKAAQSQELQV